MRKRNPLRRAAAWLAAVCLTLPLLTSPAGSTGAQSTASSAAAGEVVGYYAGWSSYLGYAPGDVPVEQLTQINYAFAAIDGDTGKLVLDNPTQDKKNFQGLLALKKRNPQLRIVLSVGGWDYSTYFSDVASTAKGRETFAQSCVDLLTAHSLDGIDLDWEYPVSGGQPGVIHRPADRENFTLLLRAIRDALDLLSNCKRFVLDGCGVSNEVMAQLREDYRDKTKVVWRVPYGGGSCMTDCEVIRCTYELTDKNAQNLVYCEDVRFMDVGHNDVTFLSDFSFLKGMPKLEAIIISSAYVSDLTPFANCKELKFFEAAFCGNIEDLSPLAQCEKLEMVNISFTKVKDLSPLDNLPIKTLFAQNYSAKRISAEEQSRFASVHPDCLTQYTGDQPYGRGWRYDEHDKYLPYYGMLRKVFRLDDNIIPNSVGWYLREGDTDLPTAES